MRRCALKRPRPTEIREMVLKGHGLAGNWLD